MWFNCKIILLWGINKLTLITSVFFVRRYLSSSYNQLSLKTKEYGLRIIETRAKLSLMAGWSINDCHVAGVSQISTNHISPFPPRLSPLTSKKHYIDRAKWQEGSFGRSRKERVKAFTYSYLGQMRKSVYLNVSCFYLTKQVVLPSQNNFTNCFTNTDV